VNRELEASIVFEAAVDRLRIGARLAVITFHSLEDRISRYRAIDQRSGTVKVLTKNR
jgi:16S rRNA C1402 N4-methylase RsmH